MNPAGLHVCHVGPCPYMQPIPDTDASHIIHIGSSIDGSIGHNIGASVASLLICWKHDSCTGIHTNGILFFTMFANGPVYIVTSGMYGATYCTSPRNLWTSLNVLGVRQSRIRFILSTSACMPLSSMT